MKIDRSFRFSNHVQWQTNHVKEEVKSTIKADSDSRHKPINKMDLQREIRIALTEKKKTLNNNLQTTKLKLMSC